MKESKSFLTDIQVIFYSRSTTAMFRSI